MGDYRDYVIKDGQFIGAFEEMYQACQDPWHQDEIQPLAEDVALSVLLRSGRCYGQALDLGCGKGRFTERLLSTCAPHITALDISPTAIAAAKSRRSEIEFLAASIPPIPFSDKSFDLVVSAELLWYLLPRLSTLFSEVVRVLKPNGHYLIIQHFYQAHEQKYGREIMQTPEDLIRLLPSRLQLIKHVEVDRMSNHRFVALLQRVS